MPQILMAETVDVVDAPAMHDVDPGRIDVGARLLKLRKDRELTLQEISSVTGVSASAFSKIERNELSPTISTLQRIASGLGIELSALVSNDQHLRVEHYAGRRSLSRSGQGREHSTGTCNNVLLCPDLKNKLATPILTTVTARSPAEYDTWPKSEAEIFVMVLDGTMVVHSLLYEPVELQKGDSLYYDASTEHTWTSKGPTDAVVVWVIVER